MAFSTATFPVISRQAKVQGPQGHRHEGGKQGSITKLVCSYPNGINFTYRTKAACKLEDDKACAAGAAELPGHLRLIGQAAA